MQASDKKDLSLKVDTFGPLYVQSKILLFCVGQAAPEVIENYLVLVLQGFICVDCRPLT